MNAIDLTLDFGLIRVNPSYPWLTCFRWLKCYEYLNSCESSYDTKQKELLVVFHRLYSSCAAGFLGAALLLAGCHALHLPGETKAPVEELEPAESSAPEDERSADELSKDASSADAAALENYPAPLAQGSWVVRMPGPDEERAADEPHWRHAELEVLIAQPDDARPVFADWLDHPDPVVAGNAAIALARLGKGDPAARLAVTVQQPLSSLQVEQRMAMRRAAVEALGQVQQPSPTATLRELLVQYSDGPDPQSRAAPPLQAELIAALSHHAPADEEPLLLELLKSPDAEVRLAVVEHWPQSGEAPLPKELVDRVGDSEVAVRRAALALLAVRRHLDAVKLAQQAMRDAELEVRLGAIAALGAIGDEAARAALATPLADPVDRVRAAAVAALAASEHWSEVLGAAEDSAWRVRLAVAEALDRPAGEAAPSIAGQLLKDASGEVSAAMTASLADWPLEQAGPILLVGLDSAAFTTRTAAAEQLRDRWQDCPEFDASAPAARRAEQLAVLRASWEAKFSAAAPVIQPIEKSPPSLAPASPELLAQVEQQLEQLRAATGDVPREQAVEKQLAAAGAELIAALAELHLERKRPVPDGVYQRVLPELDPVFALLARLESSDVAQRRRAAEQLKQQIGAQPLGRLALARLVAIVTPQNDGLVWMSIQTALAGDAREPVAALQLAAMGHPEAEVRRRACLYFKQHPSPQQEAMLLGALNDEHDAVLLAAVEALGSAERLENPLPLVRLLASREKNIRLAAAAALARLKYESGYDALERLSYETDPTIRRLAAEAMGRSEQRRFIGSLVRLLDDRLGVRRAALASLTAIVGRDIGRADDAEAPSMAEQIVRWQSWYARERR